MLTFIFRGVAVMLLIAGQCAYADRSQRAENFANPPSRMRILPCKHDRYRSERGIAAELEHLEAQGFGGMAFNVRWDKDYLCNDGDFAMFAKSARAAHARGMTLWLYDEYGYPSGTAARLVLKGHPEWQARGALIAYADAKGGEEVCVESPPGNHLLSVALPLCDGRILADSAKPLPAPVDGKLVWRAPDGGSWRVCVITEDAVYKGTHASVNVMLKVPYINLLQPEPVKRFIEVTHERYAALFDPKEFSEIFTSTFTDEPSLMQWVRPMPYLNLPWCGELPADYRARTGRDLIADIPRIAFSTTEENDRRWRGAYWRMVGERVRRNYTDQLRTWCESHGIRSGGHLFAEEEVGSLTGFYGDFFGVLRGFTAPGVDCLSAYPSKISPLTPLYASSAAALNDVPIVMCEYTSHGATPEKHPAKEESLACAFKLIAGGITQMPSYHSFHAFKTADEKKLFNDRVGRAIAIVDGTFSAAEIAMYYPTEALQSMYVPGFGGGWGKESAEADGNFKRTGTALYEASRSFVIIDAEAVRAAKVEGRELVHGRLRWKAVVLPWASVLPPDIAEKLDAFRRAGGVVLATGKKPECSPERFPDSKIAAFGAELDLVDCGNLGSRLRKLVPPVLDVGDAPAPVRVLLRRDDGGMVFFLYNDSPEPWKGRMTFASRPERIELWRPVEGDHRTCALENDSLEVEIQGYGAVGLTEKAK
jgi:hypothetical protein